MRPIISILLLFCVSGCFSNGKVAVEGQYVDLGGTSFYYKSAGAGVPIVFLHGGTSTSDSWESYINKFCNSYWVIAPDSRGQGRSSLGDGPITYGRMAGDVVRLLDHLNAEKAHIVGHSDGGVIALHLLIDYPDRIRSATLLGTPYNIDNYPTHAIKTLEDYIKALADSDAAYENIKSEHSAAVESDNWFLLVNKLGQRWRTQPTFSEAEISFISKPVLIVKTDHDFFVPADVFDRMAKLIKGAEILHLPSGTHSVYRKKFEDVSEAIDKFVKSIEDTSNCNFK